MSLLRLRTWKWIGLVLCGTGASVIVASAFVHYRSVQGGGTLFIGRGQVIQTPDHGLRAKDFRPDQIGWHVDVPSWRGYTYWERLGLASAPNTVRICFWRYLVVISFLTMLLWIADWDWMRDRLPRRLYLSLLGIALFASLLCIAVAVVSAACYGRVILPRVDLFLGRGELMGTVVGSRYWNRLPPQPIAKPPRGQRSSMGGPRSVSVATEWFFIRSRWPHCEFQFNWPEVVSEPTGHFRIPMWYVLMLTVGPTLVLLRWRRRTPPGCCRDCGYNLTGNVTGRCPECGNRIPIRLMETPAVAGP